jgi:hypothetical protein
MNEILKRPIESDYTSHVAYTRALEQYCNSLESQEPVAHQKWCASLTQLLLSMPPQPAPCNCHPPQRTEQEPLLVKRTRELVEWLDACGIEGEPLNNVIALLDAPPAQPAQHGITKGGEA